MAAGLGFEPRYTASKAAVLPLDDPASPHHRSGSMVCPGAALPFIVSPPSLICPDRGHRSGLLHAIVCVAR